VESEHPVGVDANANVGIEKLLPCGTVEGRVQVERDSAEPCVLLCLHVEQRGASRLPSARGAGLCSPCFQAADQRVLLYSPDDRGPGSRAQNKMRLNV